MAKKPKSIQGWLIPKLRNIARMWPEKNKARDKAKVRVEIGKFQNGNTEYRTMFKCAGCGDNFSREESHTDHVEAVVDPATGFVDWNTYIERLFCDSSNLQILCISCHTSKSISENAERRVNKKKKSK
jgi:5-methylcytosine-specific restriction endonuclease McrA